VPPSTCRRQAVARRGSGSSASSSGRWPGWRRFGAGGTTSCCAPAGRGGGSAGNERCRADRRCLACRAHSGHGAYIAARTSVRGGVGGGARAAIRGGHCRGNCNDIVHLRAIHRPQLVIPTLTRTERSPGSNPARGAHTLPLTGSPGAAPFESSRGSHRTPQPIHATCGCRLLLGLPPPAQLTVSAAEANGRWLASIGPRRAAGGSIAMTSAPTGRMHPTDRSPSLPPTHHVTV
jgi:hypothetical protein